MLVVLLVGASVGFVNGVIHVKLKMPSFMTTLGTWFIGVGAANALLGGMAIRINDPWIRGLAIERFLGFPWGVWLALALPLRRAGDPELHALRTLYLRRSAAARNWRRFPAFRWPACASSAFTLAGVFYAIGGILAAAQLGLGNAQIGNGRLFTTVTAVVVGGTALSGGQGSVLQTLVGVLIVVVPVERHGADGRAAERADRRARPDDHRRGRAVDRPQADADREMSAAAANRRCRWSRSTSASLASMR